MAEQYYKDTIWTNHALQRLEDRRLTQQLVYKAFQNPDKEYKSSDGSRELQKRFGIHLVTVIAKQNEKKQWVIISCWMDPPAKGTEDAIRKSRYYRYKNANPLIKLWMNFAKKFLNQDF